MRILVTGASGFVGRHLVPLLVRSGHEVFGMTPSGEAPEGARGLRADVRDAHVVRRHVEAAVPDAVVHLAAVAFVPHAEREPLAAAETNALGTLVLLDSVARAAPQARVLVVSSAEVYGPVGPDEDAIAEDRVLRPATVYGASKAAAEHFAGAYAKRGLDVRVLRPFNHIGPGQSTDYAVASFADQIARAEAGLAEPIVRHGNLDAVRDFTDVRDVAAAYAAVVEAQRGALEAGVPYNVCSGRGVRVGDLLAALIERARVPIRAEPDPARFRPVEVPRFVGRPQRLREAIGWRPTFPLERTLEDVLEDRRRRAAGGRALR